MTDSSLIFTIEKVFKDIEAEQIPKIKQGVKNATDYAFVKIREEYTNNSYDIEDSTKNKRLSVGLPELPALVATGVMLNSIRKEVTEKKENASNMIIGSVFIPPNIPHPMFYNGKRTGGNIDIDLLAKMLEEGRENGSFMPPRPIWKTVRDREEENIIAIIERSL